MPGVDCGFDKTFLGKCYLGKGDPLLVPEKGYPKKKEKY